MTNKGRYVYCGKFPDKIKSIYLNAQSVPIAETMDGRRFKILSSQNNKHNPAVKDDVRKFKAMEITNHARPYGATKGTSDVD